MSSVAPAKTAAPIYGLSYRETAKAMTGFIEVAIHTILRTRQVYPPDLFVKRRRYDAPVFQSRHPALSEYISGAVKAIGEELLMGVLDRVIVVIKNTMDQPLERFIFSLSCVLAIEPDQVDKPIENNLTADLLNQYFRAFMIKLSAMESQLGEFTPEDDLSFAIVIECREGLIPSASQSESEPAPWVPASKSHTTSSVSGNAQLHAVKAVETGVINMTVLVQESEQKLARNVPAAAPASTEHFPDRIPWKDKGKERA